jgi:hypothetical protein
VLVILFPGVQKHFHRGDFGGLWIRRVSFDFTDVVTKVDNFVTNAGGIVSLEENPLDGSLVFVDIVTYYGEENILWRQYSTRC